MRIPNSLPSTLLPHVMVVTIVLGLLVLFIVLGASLLLFRRWLQAHSAIRRAILVAMIASGLAFLSSLCVFQGEQLQGPKAVVFENHLPQEIDVYVDGKFEVSLPPSETIGVDMLILGAAYIQHLEIRTKDGRVVYQQDISGMILKAQGWRIVITEQSLTPTPQARSP